MLVVYIVLIILGVFAVDSAVVACVHRRVLGKFEVISDWKRMLVFESDAGTFRLREDLQRLEYSMNGISAAVAFEDIKELELSVIPGDADWLEFMLEMDMEPSWSRERDRIDWHTVWVVLRGGDKIPLFRSGRYHRIKYFHELYTEAQLSILESLGLLVDVQKQSQEVLDHLRSRMGYPKGNYSRDNSLRPD